LNERRYSAYGATIATIENLDDILIRSDSPPDLRYEISHKAPGFSCGTTKLLYESEFAGTDGRPRLVIWKHAGDYRLRFSSVGTFDIGDGLIVSYPRENSTRELLTTCLLGPVMSVWLERRGVLALHGSAVVIEGKAVGFLSATGGGKSVVAVALLRSGYPLLTDDVLPITIKEEECLASPSYPMLNLWADEARYFFGSTDGMRADPFAADKFRIRVDGEENAFCNQPCRLRCLYLLSRTEEREEAEVTPVRTLDAVIELVRYSYAAHVVQAMGLQRHRLALLAELARRVPIRRIQYGSGTNRLTQLCDAILKDLQNLE